MLDVFALEAAARGVQCTTVLGDWPAVSAPTPACDVVVCHHVFYNVQDLAPFVTELSAHARRRVVEASKTPDDVRRRQEQLRARFIEALGGLPERTPLNARVVALSPEKLKEIPCVMIASGGRTKSAALRGVIKGGMCNVVITDEQTAKSILAMERKA